VSLGIPFFNFLEGDPMNLLLISDEMDVSDVQLEIMFRDFIYPIIDEIKEIAIVNPNRVELYAIKIAKKLNIPYLGFLADSEAAVIFADKVLYIRKEDVEKSSTVQLCEFYGMPVSTFLIPPDTRGHRHAQSV
jgi:hypothetical protein